MREMLHELKILSTISHPCSLDLDGAGPVTLFSNKDLCVTVFLCVCFCAMLCCTDRLFSYNFEPFYFWVVDYGVCLSMSMHFISVAFPLSS